MHAGLLGTGKCLNGSALAHLCESGCFGNFAGEYEAALHSCLREAYKHFRDWTRRHGLRVVQPRFTPARVHRKSRATFPALSSKAHPGKVLSFWLASVSKEWALRGNATHLDKAVNVCCWSYTSMLEMLDTYPLVMTPQQAQAVHDRGILHLRSYAYLRSLSSEVRRGLNKNMWLMMPKHHHIQEMLRRLAVEHVNPNWYNLMTGESFVGLVSKLSRSAHRGSVTLRGLQRYLCLLQLRTSEIA